MSLRLDSVVLGEQESDEETETPVAIQWHISDHFGESRDGASGSVRAIV